ncbi:uncharacterized protein LOC128240703 isoform X7 [Mya arenaria]|uniref:uncharacterized protein LOC128240703 isoform X7 n=1 Tax=Mya arenaria TaxID=6604 RepID=UPI0022E78E11|nr:uncharacterized protein LOC128240703 isoform X7 [Mya arenaria]
MGRLPRGVVWTLLLSILIGQSVAQGDFGPPDSYDLDLGSTPADIVFVVDTSGFSNSTESLNQEVAVKGFLTGFLENADINSGNVKVAMVTYSTHPKVIFDLNKYSTKTDMEDAVFLADFEEEEPRERNLADALSLVRTKILVRDRRDAPNFVLLLMSGKSDRNSVRTLQEADGLKFARANIFGIGISLDDDDAEEMFEVSSKPTMENTFLISSVYELEMLRELVFMQIFARAEQAFKAPAAGSETLDLAFLLHYSNSVSREDFQRILDFMKNILQYSDIDDDKLRVGAVVFRKRGIPLFDFNNYYSQEEVFGGIDQINYNYRSKTSSIASGFDTVRTSLFTRTGGEREPAPNLVILITDSNADTDVDQTITAVERMKADGAAVYVVGINVTYPEELLSIASNPSYNVLVKDASELEGHDEQFHNDFVALRAKGFPVVIPALESSTSGTFADTTPVSTQNSDEAEIVFLVHASKKTTTKDFKNNLIQYIIGIIQRADTTKNKFGVVMYGDSPEVVLKLTSFPKAKLVKKALKKIKPNKRSKRADLLKALSFVREQVFNGDDPNLPNGIVLIRDQKSKRVDDNHLGTELSLLEASGTNLFQIGIGQQVENDKESELVTNTFGDDSVTNVGSYGELSNSPEVVKLLSRKIRSFHQEEIDLIIAVHTQHNTALKNVKKHIQVLLKDILSAVDINSGAVQVSIVTFGAKTKVHFPLNAFNKDKKLMKAFKKIKRKEYRSKGSDLMTLLTTLESDVLTPHSGDRQGVENLILVITDSASSSDLNMLKQKAEEMKKGNTIFAIGVDSANEDELKALASSPENEFFYNGKKYDDLTKSPELREQMIRNVKIFESLTVPATTKPKKTTPKPKVTKADTTTTTPSFTTTTRSIEIETTRMTTRQRLFTTTTTPVGPSRFYVPLSVSEVADIVLLVHLSPRITEMEFITVQEFLKSLVSRADIANGKAQIGLVFYGADPEIIFHINQYNDIALMQKSIDGMRADLRSYTSDASTAIASAKQMLSPYFNRRDDVPAAMIFIADDPANTNFDVMRDERDRAIEDEIRILTVGIGVSDKSKLESLASDPDFIMNYDNVWMLNDAENDLTEKIFAFQNDGVTEDKLFEETTLAAKTTTPADTTVSEGIITKSDGIVLELPSSLVDPNKCSLGNSDLVIILDASTSVTQQNYDKMLQFTKDLLQNADIDSGAVRVGILIYSTEVQVIFNLNEYSRKADVFAAIDKIPYIYGSTNTADALQTMHAQMFTPRNGDRPNVPNTGIIITDGVSNINSRRTISEADDARTAGIHVYAIGIGLTDTRELDGIANTPKTENSFNVQTFDELVGLDRKIFSALCPEKAVTVPVTTPKPKSSCGLSSVDVVIIIDASTSVTEPNFKLMLEFCKDIVKGADIDSGSVRVGVLIYSTEVEIQFHLNRYSTNAQVIDAIDKIPYIYGSTNTADALLTMHQTMFTPANGDRQGVENVAIVLTDGVSNINSRRTIKEAVTARSKDIEVYVIGISLTDTREVEGMASEPKDKYLYNVRRFEELQGLEEDIFGAGEGGDCATPAPATPAPATLAPKTECGLSKVDAVIILDASTSVTEPNFKKMLSFCKEIVDKAAIDSGSVRIGVLIYSTEVEIEFHLNKYTNTADIKAAIDRIPYIYGSTNSADALKTMHEVMFTARNGDRPDVDNIAFMITDGISNINGRRTIPEAENAQGKDIRVYAIGIGLTDTRELEGMASEPKSENMFNVREFDELTGLIDTIFGGAEECALSEPPVANAGPDVTRRYPSGTITLDGRRSSDDNGIVTYTWSQGGRDLFTGATFDLYDLREGEYEYNLTVVDEDGQSDSDTVRVIIEGQDFPPRADAGEDITIKFPKDNVELDGTRSSDDIKVVRYSWALSGGEPGNVRLGDVDASTLRAEFAQPGSYTFNLTVYDGAGQMDQDSVNVVVEEADIPPVANAGNDVTIQLPLDYVTLDGTQSSDDGKIVSYNWVLTDGASSDVDIIGNGTPIPAITNLKQGNYTFSLEVTDDVGLKDKDSVEIVVKAPDNPPVADAGRDVSIQLPVDTVTLDGSRSSDDIRIVQYLWTLVSGAPGVQTTGDTSSKLLVEGLAEGDYTFALSVFDALGQADEDEVTISVRAGNQPPKADAGEDVEIQLPVNEVTLDGRRSTDDVRIARYRWRIREGDENAVVMDGDRSAVLQLSNLTEGTYGFSLTVADNEGERDTDYVNVVVKPEPTPTCGFASTDLVFVVDASTSVTEANFKKQLAFMKNIVNYADIDSGSVRVGALIYSTEVEVQFYLNQYSTKNDVIAAIDKIPYIYGSTNTADGLQVMRDELFSFRNGDRDDAPNIAMVITDGVSNINGRRTIPEAITTRDLGIKIFAVGIGLTDTRELEGIASIPSSDNAFAVSDFDELVGLEQKIFTSICDKPSTTPPTTPTTTTTTQATPTTTSGCGLAKTDLVFILDASTSVTDANFQKMRDFLKEFLSNADIDSGSVRVGVNIYSTDVQVEFHLNRYTKAADVMSAIDNIPYIYGSTNTADALQSMANVMFTPQNGDRPDAPNVCILLTDGVSNINSRRTIPEAERARAKNVHLYVIGIGLTDTREVTAIATPPASKNLFSVNSFDELKGLHKTILNTATCKDEISEPPVADAGSDRTIQLPLNSITLSGDGSRDDVGIVRYEWSQLSGPRVNVRDTNDPMLSVDRLTEGVYEFELNVTDVDGQSDTDTVVITVLPEPDLPPRADAGPDKQVKLPNDRVTLSGRGSSDDKRITRWVWRLVNGNARGVTMSGQNTDTLDLSRLQEGTYTFGLTVYDAKGQMDEDEVTITVAAAPDAPPVANAGQDYTIQLPDDSVTLDGSRSSDDVRVITYRWKMTQGYPGSVRMSGERTPRLNVNGLSEGEYVFTLTVTDGKEQLDEDEARVIVKKAPRVEGYDVIFVLDSSVTPEHFRWMNNYARAVVREMSIDDGEFRVGYLIYSNSAYRQFDLQDYGTRSDVLSAIDKVGYRPGTKNTAAALKYARKQMFTPSKGDREYAKNYLILLTGDNPSDDPFGAATEACQLQAEGVGMFGVGFGDFSNRDELTAYSSVPNDEYQSVMRQESDQSEAPGLMLYNLKNRTPRPSACPVVVTTPYNGDCFASGDIVFILDSSGSVGQDNFYRVLNFTYSTIDGLDIDSGHFRVGVTTFSDSSRLDFNLNDFSNKQDIHDALTQVRYMYGNTHTAHALRRARLEMFQLAAGDRPDVPNVIVIITDGQSNINHEMTIPEARHLKAAGVTIITLAVGFTSETSELVGLTSPPISENLVYTEDYESLSKVKDKLIEPLCHDSNMCRSSPCQNGGVCMDGIRSYICICPDDFFGDTCSKHCGEPSDVVIVLDSSNTVGEYNFGRLKEYSEHLVREMNKDSCDVNIGFMKYSSNAMVQVHLGTYDDTETNVRAVEQISYSRGRANMAAAFRSLRTEMFNGRGGDRPGARNIAYFLTDGTNDAESEMAESEAEQAISSGIRIVPIGINLRERFELDNIAEKQNLNVIEINDEPALIENTDVILRPLYEGSNDYCAENPCSNGGQCVNEPFGYSCECDIGYTGDTCTQRCSAKGDVVFAVDTSRYVTRKELKSIRRFLRSVVKRLKFNKNEFSVGMVQFTDWAQVSLTLSQGKSKKAVRKSIAGLRVHGGDPQPSIALAKAKYRIFDAYGEDKDRPNYLILITKSMRGEEDILTEANKLKLEGTRILGVGLGLTANEREYLESSVSIPFRETAMFADDRKEMDDLADRVVEYMCDDENLCAENPCRNGGVCQRLGGDFYCDCGVGYAGRYCENTCNARADIVFLLDSSGSIGHKDFRRVKKFVHNMVSDLQIGKDASRIGLATYSSKSRHGFFMSKYDDLFKLQNAIAGISYEYGNSNAAEGLRLVREHYFNGRNGDRSDIQDFLVVITDGVSNVQPDQTLIEANLIKEKGVHVYAVGIGEFDPAELNEIASKPASENAYILSDYSGLDNISNSIIKQTCRDPSVCDENPCRNGGVCVPGINGLFCECRRGYRGVHCEESCVSVKDIFFLLDSSDSVGTQNFEQAKKFINNIIEEFSSKDSFNRFSLLTYSDEVQIVFSLGRYNSLNIIQNAVKYARYRPGNTNTASALRVVDELSTEDLGDRYDAENIVFVITDGTGNVNEDDTIAAADNIKNKGARVITVGINMDDPSEVESMASSKRDSFKINKYDDLEGVLEEVVQNTCKNGNVIEKK